MEGLSPVHSSPVPVSTSSDRIQWRAEGLLFQIVSSDAGLMEIAANVFDTADDAVGPPDRRWIVEQSESHADESEAWIITLLTADGSRLDSTIAASRASAVHRIETDALDFLLSNTPDAVAVHGALLSRDGRGIVIVGPSQSGKSTLATALWRAGWSLLADDTALLHAGDVTASPTPRRMSLRYASRRLVGDSLWHAIERTRSCFRTEKGLYFHSHEVDDTARVRSTRIVSIFFLARRGVTLEAAALMRINPAKAAVALLPYAFKVRELPFMEALARVTPIAAAVPAYDLGRGNLSAMIGSVENVLA